LSAKTAGDTVPYPTKSSLAALLVCACLPCASQIANPTPANKVVEAAVTSDSGANADSTKTKPAANLQTVEESAQPGESYRVGVADELQVSVWREPEISSQVIVRPDGCISLPLLNDLQVVGLSTKQLQDMVTQKLKPFVTEPQVTIVVRQIHSRKVYLIGQVNKPGSYALNDNKTVLQLLAEAGGLSQFAKAKSIYVVRKEGSRESHLHFNYKKALSATDAGADIQLVPGDMIVVP
jgi:polysaccharide biosynthesis/export protein